MTLIIFAAGLAFGSFFNVVIERTADGKNLGGRSGCNQCKTQLAWWQLIPVLSYVFLGGRCYKCHKKIPWHYSVVELLTAAIFVLLWQKHGSFSLEFFLSIAVACSFLILFWQDALYGLLQDTITIPSIVIIFTLRLLINDDLFYPAMAALIGGMFFWIQHFLSDGKWVGQGDIRLGMLMGISLGLKGLMLSLGLGYIFGALVALVLLGLKKADAQTKLPLGVFLIPAAAIVFFYQDQILSIYFSFLI